MGAIVKTINLHGDALQPVLDYTTNKDKTDLVKNGFEGLMSYTQNPEKTTIELPQEGEKYLMVSGVLCNPNTASEEFQNVRNKYNERHPESLPTFEFTDKKSGRVRNVTKEPVMAIHIIQSFEDTDIDPRVANQIGIALAEKLGVQAVVSTHCNQDLSSEYGAEHIHNHIVANAYMPDGKNKFFLNKDKIIELRRLSDEILRDFGVEVTLFDPAIQQQISVGGHNFGEWKAHKNGISWKDQVRADIIASFKEAVDREMFVAMMEDYGYQIMKEKDGNICWKHKDNGKLIWDYKLGEEYATKGMFKENDKITREIERPDDKHLKDAHRSKLISISRYDIDGRKRSAIELLIRRAIHIIQRVSNFINNKTKVAGRTYNANAKLEMMQEALKALHEYGVDSVEDLNEKVDLAGKNLNIAKGAVSRLQAEMKFYNEIEKVITNYKNAKTLYDSVYYWTSEHSFMINNYSNTDIDGRIAEIAPLSTREKSELFQLMEKHPEFRIENAGKGYSNVSALQFRQIRDFFKGKITCPLFLVPADSVNHKLAYERQYRFLSERITNAPSAKQIEKAIALLHENGHSTEDIASLTVADISNIENCYGHQPLSGNIISPEKQKVIADLLASKGINIARPVEKILDSEYDDLLGYLNGTVKTKPSLFKDSQVPSPNDLEKTKKLALSMYIHPAIAWEDMSANDVRSLYNWMISQGETPFCIQKNTPLAWERNKEAFHNDIANETLRKQEVLIGLRNAMNELASLGIEVSNIEDIEASISSVKRELENATIVKDEFSDEYKKLLRLKQQTMYAKDRNFLYGALFDSKEISEIEKQSAISETKDVEKDAADVFLENEEPQVQDTEEKDKSSVDKDKKDQIISRVTKKHRILDKNFDL